MRRGWTEVNDMRTTVLSSRGRVCGVELEGLWFDVEYDPNLQWPGITEYHPRRVVKLREWDSEVFLHECIHIAFAVAQGPLGRDFSGNLRLTAEEQETFVQHLSHFLDGVGFRVASNGDSQA
jgi:hypothetical protein